MDKYYGNPEPNEIRQKFRPSQARQKKLSSAWHCPHGYFWKAIKNYPHDLQNSEIKKFLHHECFQTWLAPRTKALPNRSVGSSKIQSGWLCPSLLNVMHSGRQGASDITSVRSVVLISLSCHTINTQLLLLVRNIRKL